LRSAQINKHRAEANLTLSQKQLQEGRGGGAGGTAKSGAIAPQVAENRPAMHWAALRAAHQMFPKKEKSFVLEYIYNSARTYFSKNC
jgi:hypothetical protein